MSRLPEVNLSTLDPAAQGGEGAGKSKALRAEPKAEGEGGVFRLDSLAPGAGGEGLGGAPLTAPTGSRVSQAAIFFAVLIIAGGGMLFVMRKVGFNAMSAFAKMKEPEVDLTRNAAGSRDHHRVLRDLSESTVKGQVPIDQVQKNPFEIPEVVAADASNDPEVAARQAAERARKEAAARKQRLETALANLKVHGILGGSNPVARINDQAVRVGDVVDEFFTVKAIKGRSVELEYEGETFTISLDDPAGATPRKSSGRKSK